MLELKQVNQSYGGSRTLWDVDAAVREGSCTCLMGRNGVGKTTLLKTIMGTLRLDSGSIRFMSQELAGRPPEQRARAGIGYVPQGRDIFAHLTVAENLRIGPAALRSPSKAPSERILELFPVLKRMLKRRGGDLSGGQQQQLAIGRALALDPKLLVLDEPTEGIQPSVVAEIADVLRYLNEQEKITILLVEQKLKFARKVASDFALMERGRIVATGPMDDLDEDLVNRHLAV